MCEMYCIACHGRGLDNQDHTCRRCKGSGYEPEDLEPGYGMAGCMALHRYFPTWPSPGRPHVQSGAEGSTPSLDTPVHAG
jgi:hypothetical protein